MEITNKYVEAYKQMRAKKNNQSSPKAYGIYLLYKKKRKKKGKR